MTALIAHLYFLTFWAEISSCIIYPLLKDIVSLRGVLPNQELSGAKSELLGEAVGVCSSYMSGG